MSWQPEWPIPPTGETLQEYLDERGWSQAMLAREMGISSKHLNQFIKGRVPLTVAMAMLLERETGISARFWLHRDADYWLSKERHHE